MKAFVNRANTPEWPYHERNTQPSLEEANRAFGGETLSPNQKREAPIQETTIPKREMASPNLQ